MSGIQGATGANLIEQARADLAARLHVAPAAITFVRSERVVWRDGARGCPQPGVYYTQAQTPGWRILLQAEGRVYHYHAGRVGPPFLCTNPEEPPERTDI